MAGGGEGPIRLRPEAVEWRRVEGQVLALDVRASEYVSTNETGARLWETLAAGADRRALVERMLHDFDVDEATAERDVDAFLATLRERGLIEG